MMKRLFPGRTVDKVQFLTTLLDRLETTGGMVDEAQCSRTVNSVTMLDSSDLYKLYCKLNENINTCWLLKNLYRLEIRVKYLTNQPSETLKNKYSMM